MTRSRTPIIVAGVLGALVVIGYVVLELGGGDSAGFGSFAVLLLPAVAGLYAANAARTAKQTSEAVTDAAASIEIVREQTNGALAGPLTDLVGEVRAIRSWIIEHDAVTNRVRAELDQLRAERSSRAEDGLA